MMILRQTMRSNVPMYLEYFWKLGRRLQKIRNGKEDTESPEIDSNKVESRLLKSNASACSETWFLQKLDPSQIEHHRDWLAVNSTCCRFRALGKEAFFANKTFILRTDFLKTLCGEDTKTMEEARVFIRHVIAPLSHSCASQIIQLPRYHLLQSLLSLSIQIVRDDFEIFSRLNAPPLKRDPLPEELSTLLREIGLQVDRLQMDIQLDKEDWAQMRVLDDHGYSTLRAKATLKRRVR